MNPATLSTSDTGIAAIKVREGCKLVAYPDPATGGDPITIGVGHTGGVRLGDRITDAQADDFLRADLGTAEKAIGQFVSVDLTQGQFDALASFVFNVGVGAFRSSTLLRMLNAGQYDQAADQFLRWNRAGGRIMAGLTKRRISERIQFLTGNA